VEGRVQGVIRSGVVYSYATAVGVCVSASVLLALAVMQLSRNASDWWLSQWSADVDDGSAGPGSADVKHIAR
jgi:hypothetical protein